MTLLSEYDFYMLIRQALLLILDAIERKLGICPTTADIRKASKSCE